MRLKCLLKSLLCSLSLLREGWRQKNSLVEDFSTTGERLVSLQASDSDARQTLQTECPKRLSDCLRQNLGARQGELDKETNRKTPGRLLTQSRGDNKKIFTKTRDD